MSIYKENELERTPCPKISTDQEQIQKKIKVKGGVNNNVLNCKFLVSESLTSGKKSPQKQNLNSLDVCVCVCVCVSVCMQGIFTHYSDLLCFKDV